MSIADFGVLVESAEGTRRATGEVGAGAGGRFVLTLDDAPDPFGGPAAALAVQLAMLVGLGPRPHRASVVELSSSGSGGTADLAALLTWWSEAERCGTALDCDDVVMWTAWGSRRDHDDREVLRAMTVVDGGAAGYAFLEPAGGGVALRTARPVEVWARLTRLLSWPAGR